MIACRKRYENFMYSFVFKDIYGKRIGECHTPGWLGHVQVLLTFFLFFFCIKNGVPTFSILIYNRAIRDYFEQTGFVVGFKPAGGIRTGKDACTWLILIKEELGDTWLNNNLFRIGASGLLVDIERQLFHYVTGRYAASHELAMS